MTRHFVSSLTLAVLSGAVALAQSPGTSRPVPQLDDAFKRVDANQDAKLDAVEFGRFIERSRSLSGANAVEVFGKLDANKDSALTLEEFRGIVGLSRGTPAPPTPKPEPASPTPAQASPEPTSPKPAPSPITAEKPITPAGLAFFEKKIRPVLADKCYKCHSSEDEKVKGGLALDTRAGTRAGGDSGHAVVPGDLEASLLIKAIRYHDKDLAMPPEKSGGKLADEVIKDFETWVQYGAPDPREGESKVAKKGETWTSARQWWAWQPPKKSPATPVNDAAWPRNDIDRFLLSALETKGLKPVDDADKPTLLRRVTYDLTGLPPTPQEVSAFRTDSSPDAFEKVVERLLESRQFGEKFGRHWLDVARYAESTGKDINLAFPNAWRYRDYVIAAFNKDKPYDQFLREQLAGDLLPAKDDQQRTEQLIATGFLAMGTKSVNQANARQFALDLADEQIDTVSQALLGVTAACARCHDHKFDPIPQSEYYSLAGIFLPTDTHYGTFFAAQNRSATQLIELPKASGMPVLPLKLSPQQRQQKQAELDKLISETDAMANATFNTKAGGNRNPRGQLALLFRMNQIGLMEAELDAFSPEGAMRPLAMGVLDQPTQLKQTRTRGRDTPRYENSTPDQAIASRYLERDGRFARPPEYRVINDSPVFARGEVDKPGEKVPRGFLSVLTHQPPPKLPANSSGRRELAEWMLSEGNPLTARVMVNRVWLWLFGQGLVSSPDNFGTTGTKPSNQALLDTLAVKFREGRWSVKQLIREIVLSRAYQLSSTYNETNFAADPENTLVWRMSKRRLDAEAIRDAMLAISGQLDLHPPLGSPIAEYGEGPIGVFKQYPNAGVPEDVLVEAGSRTSARSVYLPIARELLPDALAVFDFAEPGFVTGSRETTNVPSQALYMLNSPFIASAAQKFAERVISSSTEHAQRIQLAYGLAFSRSPSEAEQQAASDFFARFPNNNDATTAWTSFCRALFASAEFRFLN